MTNCDTQPELQEAREAWINALLCVDFDTKPQVVLIGARWLGEFVYVARSGIYPRSRVCWRLPESLFERSGLVELAVREERAPELDLRSWDEIGWTWTGVFSATTRDGRPFLERVG